MGFINLGKLNIRKRNSFASALVSLSDVQAVYKSHNLNGPINKLYIFVQVFAPMVFHIVYNKTPDVLSD